MSEKRKEQTERLVRAAYDLVAEVGVGGLRTRDIAERAGVNLATVHYCFVDKEALLRALYTYILEQFQAHTEAMLAPDLSPADALCAHTELRMRLALEMPVALRVWRAFQGEAWTDDTVRGILREHVAGQRARLAALLKAVPFTALPMENSALAASLLLGLYDGLLFQHALDPEAFDIDEYARAVQSLLGLAPAREELHDHEHDPHPAV